jgi:hypothetical protein
VTGAERLAEVVTALESVGVSCLVMGDHAVRFYGLSRSTDHFDLITRSWKSSGAGTSLFARKSTERTRRPSEKLKGNRNRPSARPEFPKHNDHHGYQSKMAIARKPGLMVAADP